MLRDHDFRASGVDSFRPEGSDGMNSPLRREYMSLKACKPPPGEVDVLDLRRRLVQRGDLERTCRASTARGLAAAMRTELMTRAREQIDPFGKA